MPGIWEAMRDCAQPVLDPHQVAAAAARPAAHAPDRAGRPDQRQPLDPDHRRARPGARPSRTRRNPGRGWRRWRSSTAPGSRPASSWHHSCQGSTMRPSRSSQIAGGGREAGATGIGGIALHLRGEVRQIFFDWLRAYRPDLIDRYERLYARGAYAPVEERRRLGALVRGRGVPPTSRFSPTKRATRAGARSDIGGPERTPANAPIQASHPVLMRFRSRHAGHASRVREHKRDGPRPAPGRQPHTRRDGGERGELSASCRSVRRPCVRRSRARRIAG